MAEKPDYYEVLGVAKTATIEDIKKAQMRIAMRCHPDVVNRNTALSEEQKKEQIDRGRLAVEAVKMLEDPRKRDIYDRGGHKALEKFLAGGTSSTSSPLDVDKIIVRGPKITPEDAFDFFDKMAEKDNRETKKPADGLTAEQRRARADEDRRERLRQRQQQQKKDNAGEAPSPAEQFNDAVRQTTEELRAAIKKAAEKEGINVDALEKMVYHLQGFLDEANKIIRDAKNKRGGPDHKP